MKTSKEWWDKVKADDNLFNEWLVKQYRGEVTASQRIRVVVDQFNPNSKQRRRLLEIADQEEMHAKWVLELLKKRGITPSIENAEERYWKQTLPQIEDIETAAAVGAHAELMRLERINAIVDDKDTPADVRVVFAMIQKQEMWHATAFHRMAGEAALEKTKGAHELGKALLGLEP